MRCARIMGFFAEFSTWLNALLASYIGDNTARIAAAIEPAVVTLAVVYVMVWGFLQLTGRIEEPWVYGLRRIIVLAVVLGVSLRLWLYNTVVVDTFLNAPVQLAAAVIGAFDPVGIIDEILLSGGDAASRLIEKGGVFDGDFSYYLAGFFVYVVVGFTAIYTMFLLALSRIALSVLLALGPLFIALLLFETTKRFFEAWIAQLANFALITVLTVLVAALMMRLLTVAAAQAADAGGGIEIAHAVRVCLAAGLVFLVMRQVMPMAAGIASGIALSTTGLTGQIAGKVFVDAVRAVTRSGRDFARGAMVDAAPGRADSVARRSGQYVRRAALTGMGAVARRVRRNVIRPEG